MPNDYHLKTKNILKKIKTITWRTYRTIYLGIDQRQRNGVGGRRGLLSGVQRYDIGSQCGQRSSIY